MAIIDHGLYFVLVDRLAAVFTIADIRFIFVCDYFIITARIDYSNAVIPANVSTYISVTDVITAFVNSAAVVPVDPFHRIFLVSIHPEPSFISRNFCSTHPQRKLDRKCKYKF